MGTERRFCRFTPTLEGNAHGVRLDDPDGMCLSAFVILTSKGHPSSVLVGKLNPAAPWDHLGGLPSERVRAHQDRWTLPASQLMLREGPDEAAHRILRELLGGIAPSLGPPRVVSEVYAPKRFPGMKGHWDLHFLYTAPLEGPPPSLPHVWADLRFVDVPSTPRSAFGRSHDEILDLVGLSPAQSAGG